MESGSAEEQKKRIEYLFFNTHDNSTKTIARKVGLNPSSVDQTIDRIIIRRKNEKMLLEKQATCTHSFKGLISGVPLSRCVHCGIRKK